MTELSRRKLGLGIAASVVALPTVAKAIGAASPAERVRYHTEQISTTMRDLYGVSVQVLAYDDGDDCVPMVLVAANGRTPIKKENSSWVQVGPDVFREVQS